MGNGKERGRGECEWNGREGNNVSKNMVMEVGEGGRRLEGKRVGRLREVREGLRCGVRDCRCRM